MLSSVSEKLFSVLPKEFQIWEMVNDILNKYDYKISPVKMGVIMVTYVTNAIVLLKDRDYRPLGISYDNCDKLKDIYLENLKVHVKKLDFFDYVGATFNDIFAGGSLHTFKQPT